MVGRRSVRSFHFASPSPLAHSILISFTPVAADEERRRKEQVSIGWVAVVYKDI